MSGASKLLVLVLLAFLAETCCGCGPDCVYLEIRYVDPDGEWISVAPYTVELEVGHDRLELAYPVPLQGGDFFYEVGGFPFRFSQSSLWVDSGDSHGPSAVKITLRSEKWTADAVIRPDYHRDPVPEMEDCDYAFEELHLVPKSP